MRVLWIALLAVAAIALGGCSKSFYGGAAAGVGAAGVAYELNNKRQLDNLEDDYRDGDIDRRKYERRREDIEDGSLIY